MVVSFGLIGSDREYATAADACETDASEMRQPRVKITQIAARETLLTPYLRIPTWPPKWLALRPYPRGRT